MSELPELPTIASINLPKPSSGIEDGRDEVSILSVEEEEDEEAQEEEKEAAEKSDQLANCKICPYNDIRAIIISQETMETLAQPPLEICMMVFPTDTQKAQMEEGKIPTKCPYDYNLRLRKALDERKKIIELETIQIEGSAPQTGHQPPNFPRPPLTDLLIVNVDLAQALRVKLEKGNYTTIAVGGALALGTVNEWGIRYEYEDVVFLGVGGAADYEIVALKPVERTLGELYAEDVPDEERAPGRGA